MDGVQLVLSVLAGVTALVVLVVLVRDARPGLLVLGLLVVLEVGVLVQLVVGVVMVAGGAQGVSVAAYLAYLIGGLLILPVGLLWSAAEETRSGTGVLLVAVLLVPVLCLRVHDIWATHA